MLDTFEMPVALVANKADMVHLRQVSTEEGTYINSTKCVQWNKLYLLFLYCVLNIVKHIFKNILCSSVHCAYLKKSQKITSDLFHPSGEVSDHHIHIFNTECKVVSTPVFLCECHRITVKASIHIITMKTKYIGRSDQRC